MKKIILFLLSLLLLALLSTPLSAQQKNVAVPLETLEKIQLKLKRLKILEEATPEVKILKLELVQDQDSRIFVKDTVAVEVKLADLKYEGIAKLQAKASMYPKKDKVPFVTRFGLMAALEQDKTDKTKKLSDQAFYLTYRVFKYRKLSLEAVANHKRAGAGLGYQLTPNTKIVGGVAYPYGSTMLSNTKLVVGVGFNF